MSYLIKNKSKTKTTEDKKYRGLYFSGTYTICRGAYKTARLVIDKEMNVLFKCNNRLNENRILRFIEEKELWIKKRLEYFKNYLKQNRKIEFVSGEEMYYLGRQYQLIVHKEAEKNNVEINKNTINIYIKNNFKNKSYNQSAEKIYLSFLEEQEKIIFYNLYEEVKGLFDYKIFPPLHLRKMSRKWGSYNKKIVKGDMTDKIVLNKNLIKYDIECIKYVLIHELCHIKEMNHSPRFWRLVESKYPGWRDIKEELQNK